MIRYDLIEGMHPGRILSLTDCIMHHTYACACCTTQDPVSETADAEQEEDQQQRQPVVRSEEGSSGSTSKEETPAARRDSSSRTEDVRLWVLEISTSGLVDTPPPRMHTVRRERAKTQQLFMSWCR